MEFFAGDVERITGVQRLRLHHWLKEGFLSPSVQIAQGGGDRNIYSREDLYKIALMKRLLESGVHGKIAKSLLNWNFEDLRTMHLQAKKEAKQMALSVARALDNSKPPEVIISIHKQFPILEDRVYEFFKLGYDIMLIINMSRVIDEVDLNT